jgi:hypothetical protein
MLIARKNRCGTIRLMRMGLPPVVRGGRGGVCTRTCSSGSWDVTPPGQTLSRRRTPTNVKSLEFFHRCSPCAQIRAVRFSLPALRRLSRVGCAHRAAGSTESRTPVPAIDGHRGTIVPPDPPPLRKGGPGGVKPRLTNPCAIDAHLTRHPHHSNSSRFRKDAHPRKTRAAEASPPFARGGQGDQHLAVQVRYDNHW